MRLTQHCGRVGNARHNDRAFLEGLAEDERKELAPRIHDGGRVLKWTCYGKETSFADAERRFYEARYSEALRMTNEAYVRQRHPERKKTMDDVLRRKATRPEEVIYQIGDKDDQVDIATFTRCFNAYWAKLAEWNKKAGNHLRIISIAIHADETSVHAHVRRVWEWKDAQGIPHIGQNKALQQAGIELPDGSKPEGRYNCRKMAFDAMSRQMWLEACRENGLTIETDPRPRRTHKSVDDFVDSKIQEEHDRMKAHIVSMSAEAFDLRTELNDMHREKEGLQEDIDRMMQEKHTIDSHLQELRSEEAELIRQKEARDRKRREAVERDLADLGFRWSPR